MEAWKEEFVRRTKKKRKETGHYHVNYFTRYLCVFYCFVLLALCIMVLFCANLNISFLHKTKNQFSVFRHYMRLEIRFMKS